MKQISKAVVPAAGLGTRFLPATKSIPKGILTIVDKPALHYIAEEISLSGIKEIIMITNENNGAIKEYFSKNEELNSTLLKKGKTELVAMLSDIENFAKITYVIQDKPLGLGHAILCAKDYIGEEPFAVLYADDLIYNKKPCLRQLVDEYNGCGKSIIGCQFVEHKSINKYGAVKYKSQTGRLYEIEDIIEKPELDKAPSDLASLGRSILTPEIFKYLETQEPGKGGEIQLADAMCRMAKDLKMYAYEFEGTRYDIGDKLGFLKATTEYALRDENLKDGYLEFLKTVLEK